MQLIAVDFHRIPHIPTLSVLGGGGLSRICGILWQATAMAGYPMVVLKSAAVVYV